MAKYIYLVKYWVPFPRSEHGGIQCVIASSSEECISYIEEVVSEYEKEYEDWRCLIQECVARARKYKVLSTEDSGIIFRFET